MLGVHCMRACGVQDRALVHKLVESVTHHNHLDLGTLTPMFLNDIIEKNNFRQLHSDVIFSPI